MARPKDPNSKASLILAVLEKHPDLTSAQLGARVGVGAPYVRAALRRSKRSTIYTTGLSLGGGPRLKEAVNA